MCIPLPTVCRRRLQRKPLAGKPQRINVKLVPAAHAVSIVLHPWLLGSNVDLNQLHGSQQRRRGLRQCGCCRPLRGLRRVCWEYRLTESFWGMLGKNHGWNLPFDSGMVQDSAGPMFLVVLLSRDRCSSLGLGLLVGGVRDSMSFPEKTQTQ